MIVIDASVALAWVLPDEDEERVESLLRTVESEGAVVPPVWSLEVGNALAVAERRGRLSSKEVRTAVDLLRRLPIRSAEASMDAALGQVLAIARRQKITTYDTSYLELSLRVSCPLATLDRTMMSAARKSKIELVPV